MVRVIEWPALPIAEFGMTYTGQTATGARSLTGMAQRNTVPSGRWRFTVTFDRATRAQANALAGWLHGMRDGGAVSRFPVPNPDRVTYAEMGVTGVPTWETVTWEGGLQWAAEPNPVPVDAAEIDATSLTLDGAWLMGEVRVGDLFGRGGQLFRVTGPAVPATRGGTWLTVPIWPPLEEAITLTKIDVGGVQTNVGNIITANPVVFVTLVGEAPAVTRGPVLTSPVTVTLEHIPVSYRAQLTDYVWYA